MYTVAVESVDKNDARCPMYKGGIDIGAQEKEVSEA